MDYATALQCQDQLLDNGCDYAEVWSRPDGSGLYEVVVLVEGAPLPTPIFSVQAYTMLSPYTVPHSA